MSPELKIFENGQKYHDDYKNKYLMKDLVTLLKRYENRIDELEDKVRKLEKNAYGCDY